LKKLTPNTLVALVES